MYIQWLQLSDHICPKIILQKEVITLQLNHYFSSKHQYFILNAKGEREGRKGKEERGERKKEGRGEEGIPRERMGKKGKTESRPSKNLKVK